MRNAVLPMAGHKGFGLAFMIDVISACLSGARISPGMIDEAGVGHLMVAVDVAAAAGLEDYGERLRLLIDAVHSVRRAQGTEPFLIPGEREHLVARVREHVIPLDAATRKLLDASHAEYSMPRLEGRREP